MTTKLNALNWFELYVADFARARRFYETILNTPLQDSQAESCKEGSKEGCQMAMFPFDMAKGVGGSITKMKDIAPGVGGTIVYLNVEGDLDGVLERIPAAGGSVLKPKFSIGEHGFIALFKDTEGNLLGLHTLK
jgi:predicted enzyme related to lactoylglutathione lyase